jgi:uncharacterized integral membrane protein
MRARTLFLVLVLAVLAVFAALNWAAFTARTTLSLLVAHVEAPLGLIMLAVAAGLTVLYFLYAAWLETAALLAFRRQTRELDTQRQLAQSAEQSRYAELRRFLETELLALRPLPGEAAAGVIARLGELEEKLRAEVDKSGNTLAAYLGEIEDRLERHLRGPGTPPPAG